MEPTIDMTLSELRILYRAGQIDKHSYIRLMHTKHKALFDYADYIKDADVQSILIESEKIYLTTKQAGIKLYLDKTDSRFIPIEILNFGFFDPIESNLIYFLASRSRVIFDIGANVGWYSLNFDRLDAVERIYAFEPVPYTYDYLIKNIDFNSCSKIAPNNLALTDTEGDVIFYWSETETGSSSMRNIQDRELVHETKCLATTLDIYAKRNGIKLDMIKCDVEGSELFVFKGGMEVISRDKPFIFTEMLRKWSAKFGYHPNDIIELLSSVGYRCFAYVETDFVEIDTITDATQPTNYFFLHGQKHLDMIEDILHGRLVM
ncbi:FkbM family methyltransferase [Methylomonas sp. YC3]